jgi:hypothetical protein
MNLLPRLMHTATGTRIILRRAGHIVTGTAHKHRQKKNLVPALDLEIPILVEDIDYLLDRQSHL